MIKRCHANGYTLQATPAAQADAGEVEPAETDLSTPAADGVDGAADIELPQRGDDEDDASSAGARPNQAKVALASMVISPCMCPQV